ncbi:hypothetical protein M9Y56_03155, partial [Pseudomonas juntendi]|uniref:hypothetical protein n=1 Tax=Pseudomonas juntendi TaxID=2666183 RepID=UPI002022EA69
WNSRICRAGLPAPTSFLLAMLVPPSFGNGFTCQKASAGSQFFKHKHWKCDQEPCGKPAFSSVDKHAFFLRTKPPVGKQAFNPQAKSRYPYPSGHSNHRV